MAETIGSQPAQGGAFRILHVLSSERWTGAAEPAAALAAEQRRQGHVVYFASIGGASVERHIRSLGLDFIEGFQFDRRLNPGNLWRDLRRIRRVVAEARIDIVHSHLPHDHWIAALAFGRRRPGMRPYLLRTIHRDAMPRRDVFHRWLVGKSVDRVLVVNEAQRRMLQEHVGLPGGRVCLVPGSVDLERFRPDCSGRAIRSELNIGPEAPVAGIVARMQRHRGHHLFVDTVEQVAAQVPEAVLMLAGRGELKRELLARIEGHPLRRHLRRIGHMADRLPEIYAAMDVAVLLVPGSDGSCRAMLEAMACGRPVIGTRRGAMVDTIRAGYNGWLVRPGDRDELAGALGEALSQPERTRRMGENARRHVERHHSRENHCRAVLEIYQEVVAEQRANALAARAGR